MKKRILFIASILCAINTVSTNAQTITAPTGQNLTIANSVNVTGGSVNIKADSAFKIGGVNILSSRGVGNIFLGGASGTANSTGYNNAFLGPNTGTSNTTGHANLFIGSLAGFSNISGSNNSFIGGNAGQDNTLGDNNIFMGSSAGRFNSSGSGNSFIGVLSGYKNTIGAGNIFIGQYAGYENTTGNSNTFIGNLAGSPASVNLTNATAIGANASVTTSNSVVLGNNANVGIGTSAPANKLEVVSGTAGQSGLRLTGLAGRAGNLQVNAAGDVILVASGARVAAADDANWTLTSNYLYNNSNGVVIGEGITSTPAGYKLFVSDGILTEKVKVAVKNGEDWADRVFEDNYKMLSLAQTNQYIKENKHLPGVPSTQEMIEKGNDLHKTDVILLTKIEELYRHVIKIEQENQALKKELKSLKNRKR